MTRIFWDTTLFIYLLEGNPEFAPRVQELLDRSMNRGDTLLMSYLALGEVMVGARGDQAKMRATATAIESFGFSFVPFDNSGVSTFTHLRSMQRLKPADSINLASASAARVDMFLTNDEGILKRRLHLPGIHFIVDFTQSVL